jgi:hypothetical protein
MASAKLQAAREFILEEQYETARAILSTMKSSPTAQRWLAKLDEIAPVKERGMGQWEYLELFVRASDRTPPDLHNIIEQGQFTTVEHFYSRLLNDYGAEGWELVTEDSHGGDLVRLLFKRPLQES